MSSYPAVSSARHPRQTDWHTYKKRDLIEKLFLKLKDNRKFATRYERERSIFGPLLFLPASWFGYFDGFKARSKSDDKYTNIGTQIISLSHRYPLYKPFLLHHPNTHHNDLQ